MSNTTTRKTAVITGASSGIGAVYADRLASRGYDLVLVARRADRLQELASRLHASYGVKVDALIADLGSEAGQASVEELLVNNESISVLINNAGIARLAPIAVSPLENSLSQIALNITALTRFSQAILPAMKSRNEGTIINIASAMAMHTLPVSSVYSGTKAFVLAFSRGLQQELEGTAVKVQVVLPAATATEVWDNSGIPLAALAPETVMPVEAMVDAALFALDQGELTTWPSVADAGVIERFEAVRMELFGVAQTGKVAPRLLPQ
jgi:short-subunit dehydrogenase